MDLDDPGGAGGGAALAPLAATAEDASPAEADEVDAIVFGFLVMPVISQGRPCFPTSSSPKSFRETK